MLFYFTATGNSLYVAKQLDENRFSIAQAIHEEEKVYTADKIGIVCPVFRHEAPLLVKEFLSEAKFETDYFYMILTYGSRHGGAPELAQRMLAGFGIHPAYINMVWMADNFLPGFDMSEQKRMDKKEDVQIARIREDIEAGKAFISPVTDTDRADHQKYLNRTCGMRKGSPAKIYRITGDCIGCGICTRVCPKRCFSMDGQKSVWDPEGCMMCMACIHACPMLAIKMRIPEKNSKERYRNENISICEIIEANNQWREEISG